MFTPAMIFGIFMVIVVIATVTSLTKEEGRRDLLIIEAAMMTAAKIVG